MRTCRTATSRVPRPRPDGLVCAKAVAVPSRSTANSFTSMLDAHTHSPIDTDILLSDNPSQASNCLIAFRLARQCLDGQQKSTSGEGARRTVRGEVVYTELVAGCDSDRPCQSVLNQQGCHVRVVCQSQANWTLN